MRDDTIRVACVPAGHDYSRALAGWPLSTNTGSGDHSVVHMPDPSPLVPSGEPIVPGQWWPPRMLDATWIRQHGEQIDVAHVQFGVEQVCLDALSAAVDELRAARIPLIVTVHDILNPQFRADSEAQKPHVDRLALLIGCADAIVTLTPGAASEISRRWCRDAQVIMHPSMIAPRYELPIGTRNDSFVVGINLGDLRPNIRALETIESAIGSIELLRASGIGARLRVLMRSSVRDAATRDRVLEASRGLDFIEIVQHDRFTDAELHARVADLDLCLLPYGHGTHSGWLELCWDLGVGVMSPDVGYFAEQHPESDFFSTLGQAHPDFTAALADSIGARASDTRLARAGSAHRADLQATRRRVRRVTDDGIRAEHENLYRRLLAEVRT